MPLISIKEIGNGTRLGLWRMTENPADYGELYREASGKFKSGTRRLEYICVRLLLKEMLYSCCDVDIVYDINGKPGLSNGGHIGISHTRGICSVIVSEHHNVAVDIEVMSDKVCRIADKFMRPDESAPDIASLLVHWCAKETVYKLFSEDNLQFHDMRLLPSIIEKSGKICMRQYRRNTDVELIYVINKEYVLTYAIDI